MVLRASFRCVRWVLLGCISLATAVETRSLAFADDNPAITTTAPSYNEILHVKDLNQLDYDRSEDQVIGNSYDSMLLEFTNNRCVKRTSGGAHLGKPTATSASMTVSDISNTNSYATSTGVSVAAAYNGPTANASASVKYLYSNKLNSYNSNLLVKNEVLGELQQYFISNFNLTDQAVKWLKLGYPIFRYACGDRFVLGFRRGATFSAALAISNESDREQSNTSASAQGATDGGSFSVGFQQALDKLSTHSSIQFQVIADGTTDTLPDLKGQQLLDYARDYPKRVLSISTMPIGQYVFADYLPLIVSASLDQKGVVIPTWMSLLNDNFQYLLDLNRYDSDLAYIYGKPDQFSPVDQVVVSSRETLIKKEIIRIQTWGVSCLMSQGKTCPDNRATFILLPGYIAPRALPWVSFDPRTPSLQYIGTAMVPMKLELIGSWHCSGDPKCVLNVTESSNVVFRSAANPSLQQVLQPASIMNVPAGYQTYYRTIDSYYPDNYPDGAQPAKGRLGWALDNFVAGK